VHTNRIKQFKTVSAFLFGIACASTHFVRYSVDTGMYLLPEINKMTGSFKEKHHTNCYNAYSKNYAMGHFATLRIDPGSFSTLIIESANITFYQLSIKS